LFGLLLLLFATTACRPPAAETQTLVGYRVVPIDRVAVMPFLPGNTALQADDRVGPALDCTLMEFCQEVNELEAGAENTLTRQMQLVMERRLGDRVLPLQQSAALFDRLPQNRMVDTPRQLAQRFGRAAGVDHVILGSVWRYRERTPGEGASVAFTAYLLEVDNGRRVWRGRFDKTQIALSEDLLNAGGFFKKGARWLSAEELARYGIEQVMQDFPETVE
jgi:hypothetical protein